MSTPTDFQQLQTDVDELMCGRCSGQGEICDAEPGGIAFNVGTCPDCKGTGFDKHFESAEVVTTTKV